MEELKNIIDALIGPSKVQPAAKFLFEGGALPSSPESLIVRLSSISIEPLLVAIGEHLDVLYPLALHEDSSVANVFRLMELQGLLVFLHSMFAAGISVTKDAPDLNRESIALLEAALDKVTRLIQQAAAV